MFLKTEIWCLRNNERTTGLRRMIFNMLTDLIERKFPIDFGVVRWWAGLMFLKIDMFFPTAERPRAHLGILFWSGQVLFCYEGRRVAQPFFCQQSDLGPTWASGSNQSLVLEGRL